MTKTRRAGFSKKRRYRGGRKTVKKRGGKRRSRAKRRSRVTRRGGKRRSRAKRRGRKRRNRYKIGGKRKRIIQHTIQNPEWGDMGEEVILEKIPTHIKTNMDGEVR